jgi:menaquinol-cytochrome c reductase iron-sulfur subunit
MNECRECPSPENMGTKIATTRRRFLEAMIAIASLLISAILGVPFIGALMRSQASAQKEKWVKVANVQTIPDGEPLRLNFIQSEMDAYREQETVHSVWIVKHSPSEIAVYSPICPHAGCYFNWNAQRRLFECPCHGSVFRVDGPVVSGPAPRQLDALPVKVENGALFVIWKRFKAGIPDKIAV